MCEQTHSLDLVLQVCIMSVCIVLFHVIFCLWLIELLIAMRSDVVGYVDGISNTEACCFMKFLPVCNIAIYSDER